MLLGTTSVIRPIVSFLVVAAVYWLSLWRIIKGNRGNRVIECGSITLMLFFLMMLLMKLTNLPDWVLPSLGLLLFLLCLLTMLFLLLQGVHAIRRGKSKPVASSASADGQGVVSSAMNGLGYEPGDSKQKRLMRTVYWGTILLVAFVLWEYMKAR
jgi:hypothetical protein